jgi:hypothetical protein
MARDTGERRERLAVDIRRQFGARTTARFLHALPAFKVVEEIPDHMRVLLDQLKDAEGKGSKASR